MQHSIVPSFSDKFPETLIDSGSFTQPHQITKKGIQGQKGTAIQLAEKALATTVFLEMGHVDGQPLGFGSGFFVQRDQIATNFHVIAGASRGTAKLVGKPATYDIEGITGK